MEKKKILIIDDGWEDRKFVYDNVLSTVFELEYIEEPSKLFLSIENNFYDGYIVDVVLDGWKTRENKPQEVLPILEKIKIHNKPIFLVSRHYNTLINENRLTPTLEKIIEESIPVESFFVYKEFEDESYRKEMNEKNSYTENLTSLIQVKVLQYEELWEKKENKKADIGIVCALNEELQPILDNLETKENFKIDSLSGKRGIIRTDDGNSIKVVAASQQEMGTEDAAIIGSILTREFNIKHLFMTGVCGGRQDDVKIGDIIIPAEVIAYQRGKIDDGKLILEAGNAQSNVIGSQVFNDNCEDIIKEIFNNYIEILKEKGESLSISIPTLSFKEMACGANVISDSKEDLLEKISKDVAKRKLCAVDMGSYSILRLNKFLDVNTVVIKSVMDLAKDKNDKYKEYASYVSANFLIEVLKKKIYNIEPPLTL